MSLFASFRRCMLLIAFILWLLHALFSRRFSRRYGWHWNHLSF